TSATINILLFNQERIVVAAEGRILGGEHSRIITDSYNKITRIGKYAAISWNGITDIYTGESKLQSIQHIINDFKIQNGIGDSVIISPKDIADSLNIKFTQLFNKDTLNTDTNKFYLFIFGYTENHNRQIYQFTFPSDGQTNNNSINLKGKIEELNNNKQVGLAIKGEAEVYYRLMDGYDTRLANIECLTKGLKNEVQYLLPLNLLTINDMIDFAIFIIETTNKMNRFNYKSNDGVGGDIDIAVITPYEGFRWIQLDE
ncbi:MAG: hypothetical protein GY855_12080, partial [candidate division Zixibacteria bacterium]|nr:hypothetical protein [candidate division Zixibacteria bacterium]